MRYHNVFRPYMSPHAEQGLNLGSGPARIAGWVNADLYGSPDVRMDIRQPWPFKDNSFQTIYAAHVLEHCTGDELFPLFWEAGRVLKPGGHLLIVTPYGYSHMQLGSPHHKQCWLENTPKHFCAQHWAEEHGTSGMEQGERFHIWNIPLLTRVVAPKFKRCPQWLTAYLGRHLMNVYVELLCVMQVMK